MKIYDLNYQCILNIMIFLDLETIHKIKLVNSLFLNYHKLAFRHLNFIAAMIINVQSLKYSYLNNPNTATLKVFNNYQNAKLKIFKNFSNKKHLNIKIRNDLLKTYYSDSYKLLL